MTKTILVTGASSGIGRRIAALLARSGYRVFGTSRRPTAETLDSFAMLPLDVTDPASVQACVDVVTAQTGQIDVLVNNAGVELLGALEETTVEEAQHLFNVNLWGVVRMTNAVLPAMRARRSGTIINIGSVAGFAAGPIHGYYIASKHALEGYTEALMYELEPFNIHVALVEPGYFRSDLGAKRIIPANRIPAYDTMRERVGKSMDGQLERAPEPHAVANKVLDIIEGRSTTLRNVVTTPGLLGARYSKVLPEWLVFAYSRRYNGVRPLRDDIPLLVALIAPIVSVFTIVRWLRRKYDRRTN